MEITLQSTMAMLALALTASCSSRLPSLPGLLPTIEHESVPMSEERLGPALAWARQELAEQDKHAPYPYRTGGHSARRMSPHAAALPRLMAKAKEALVWLKAAKAPEDLTPLPISRQTRSSPPKQLTKCNSSSKYRTIDGTCNNKVYASLGASGTAARRILKNTYDDGIEEPRSRSVSGGKLPLARKISQTVIADKSVEEPRLTLSVVNWGQFLDHDLVLTPVFLDDESGREPACCSDNGPLPDAHPQCMAIEIPEDDPFYSIHGKRCMEFVRSIPADPSSSGTGSRLTKNLLTSYLDGSAVYGSDERRLKEVRVAGSYLLKTQANGQLLPVEPPRTHSETSCFAPQNKKCFLAGDDRVTVQSGLTVVHTVMVKQHNRIAEALAALNTNWSTETVFQETRRIIIAQIQRITYAEWLPKVVGEKFLRDNKIEELSGKKHSNRYNEDISPVITMEFSTAAFRFGHTQVQGKLALYNSVTSPPHSSSVSQRVDLRDTFFNPQLMYDGHFDKVAKGMVVQHPQACDANVAEDITEFLFRKPGEPYGMDLMARNIQRGRDHGIPTYNDIRENCGMKRAAQFEDLKDRIPEAVIERMKQAYEHVDDVDFFVGVISERPEDDAAVGPSIRCIVGDQFLRLRWGDSFFYDLENGPRQLSGSQLEQIRRTTWAGILCENVPTLDKVQRRAFEAAGSNNPLVDCQQIDKVLLESWRDN